MRRDNAHSLFENTLTMFEASLMLGDDCQSNLRAFEELMFYGSELLFWYFI
ncbi:MAG: hypothetical protein ABFS56_06450 [Pseudomonadota bacterium]